MISTVLLKWGESMGRQESLCLTGDLLIQPVWLFEYIWIQKNWLSLCDTVRQGIQLRVSRLSNHGTQQGTMNMVQPDHL